MVSGFGPRVGHKRRYWRVRIEVFHVFTVHIGPAPPISPLFRPNRAIVGSGWLVGCGNWAFPCGINLILIVKSPLIDSEVRLYLKVGIRVHRLRVKYRRVRPLFFRFRHRKNRAIMVAATLAAALPLTACVSSIDEVTDTAALSADAGPSTETELSSDVPSADLQSTEIAFVPTKAPRPNSVVQELAEVASDTKTAPEGGVPPKADATGGDVATASVRTESGSTEDPSAVDRINPSNAKSPKKPTLLQRLLQARADKRAQEKQREAFRKARKSARPKIVARTRNFNGSGLPGVKRNAQLFGIEDRDDSKDIRLASVGGFGRLSPNGLRLQHSKVDVACLKPDLLKVLKIVERKYRQKPIVTSGYRSPKRNRRAGGASNSQHIYCKAADIQLDGVSKWELAKFLRSIPGRGGVGTYCRTRSVHIDVGPKRDWHHPCRRSVLRRKRKA